MVKHVWFLLSGFVLGMLVPRMMVFSFFTTTTPTTTTTFTTTNLDTTTATSYHHLTRRSDDNNHHHHLRNRTTTTTTTTTTIYGFVHIPKTAGSNINGELALSFERVCGNKGYSYDAVNHNARVK